MNYQLHKQDSVSERLHYIFHEVKNIYFAGKGETLSELIMQLDEHLKFSSFPASKQALPLLEALFKELNENNIMDMFFPNPQYNEAFELLVKWLYYCDVPENGQFKKILAIVSEAYIESVQDALLSCESKLIAEDVIAREFGYST